MTVKMNIRLADDAPGIGRAGQHVNLELSPSDVHDPTELPTYLAGYKPFGYRADEVSVPILVDNDEDKYRSFDQDDAFKPVAVKGALSGPVPEVDPNSALATYKVVDRYVGSFIPTITELQKGNNYQPRQAAARRCRRALQLDREIDVWTLLGTNTNWDASVRTALPVAEKWNGGASSDPIAALHLAIEKSLQPVNSVWMNQRVANAFIRHDKVRDHMRQMLGDSAPGATLAQIQGAGQGQNADFQIPGLPPIHVTACKHEAVGGTTIDYTLGNSTILLTVPPGVPMDGEEIASTYTFRRRGPSGVGFESREFFIDGRGPHGGTMVVVAMADIAVLTGTTCGGIITGCYV